MYDRTRRVTMGKAKIYMTKELSPEAVLKRYDAVGKELQGARADYFVTR